MDNATRTPSETPGAARESRFSGRVALRTITRVRSCYDCGRSLVADAAGVRFSDGVAAFSGIATCGRVWLCPVCNSKVMARRALEIGAALVWARSEGYHVLWGSLTCWHNSSSDLGELLRIQTGAWRHVMNSRTWRAANATRQLEHEHRDSCADDCERRRDVILKGEGDGFRVGYIRAAELNVGRNGWHPHFHPLIFVRGDRATAERFASSIVSLWVEGVEHAGGIAERDGAQQLRVLAPEVAFESLGEYVTKQTYSRDLSGLALETVWSQGKTGRGRPRETVSHWALLAAVADGKPEAQADWLELEEATHGHRMLTWSRGLRDLAGLADEKDDDEIAAEEIGTREDTVLYITPAGWYSICDRPEIMAGVLEAVENHGWEAAAALLDSLGVEYYRPEDEPEFVPPSSTVVDYADDELPPVPARAADLLGDLRPPLHPVDEAAARADLERAASLRVMMLPESVARERALIDPKYWGNPGALDDFERASAALDRSNLVPVVGSIFYPSSG